MGFSSYACVVPMALSTRVEKAAYIIFAKPIKQTSFMSKNNIFTAYEMEVISNIKGNYAQKRVSVIMLGGQIGEDIQLTLPNIDVDYSKEYMLFLESNELIDANQAFKISNPNILQAKPYADIQGIIPVKNGIFSDVIAEKPMALTDAFEKILRLNNTTVAHTPNGKIFDPSTYNILPDSHNIALRAATITSLTDGSGATRAKFRAGLVETTEELVINGFGFGTTSGSVLFPNADDAGVSSISQVNSSDIIAWTDTQIRLKIPFQAGTGNFKIYDAAGALLGSKAIAIEFAIIPTYSPYSGFTQSNRLFVSMVNKNTTGGYTFQYTSSFNAKVGAAADFEKAMNTWICQTGVNYKVSTVQATVGIDPLDQINVVSFDNSTLPAGTIARCNLHLKGKANGTCTLQNTFYYVTDIDIQFATAVSWRFGNNPIATSDLDFNSTALHEIGHSLSLGHVIDPTSIMHYLIPTGLDARIIDTNSLAAANYVMAKYTIQSCLQKNLATTLQPMIPLAKATYCPLGNNGIDGTSGGNGTACKGKCAPIIVKKL